MKKKTNKYLIPTQTRKHEISKNYRLQKNTLPINIPNNEKFYPWKYHSKT